MLFVDLDLTDLVHPGHGVAFVRDLPFLPEVKAGAVVGEPVLESASVADPSREGEGALALVVPSKEVPLIAEAADKALGAFRAVQLPVHPKPL